MKSRKTYIAWLQNSLERLNFELCAVSATGLVHSQHFSVKLVGTDSAYHHWLNHYNSHKAVSGFDPGHNSRRNCLFLDRR
jgi:hypothetical protein